MKITTLLLLIVAVVGVIFIVLQAFSVRTTKQTEQYAYEVLKEYKDFEIRKYEPAIFSSVTMASSSYRENSGQGFRTLAGYIFGGNERNQKIAMTSPVAMQMDDSMTMSFMVPSEMDMDDLPKPNDGRIKFTHEPSKVVAAIRFGGWSSDEKIEEYTQQLKDALEREGLSYKAPFTYLGYNPPYEMVNRRNEIMVELVDPVI